METQVRTPQMVFMQPQRLIVPLFQRPYVWNEDTQGEPLWSDLLDGCVVNEPMPMWCCRVYSAEWGRQTLRDPDDDEQW
jgi:uncharacterized protein with ParB-like and HNH nuclease domain